LSNIPNDDDIDGPGSPDDDTEQVKNELYELYLSGKLVRQDDTAAEPVGNATAGSEYFEDDMAGYSTEARLTPSQAQVRYLLDPDDVPEEIKKNRLWAVVSRHLQLIDIPSYSHLPKYQREIRDIIRCAMWRRDMKNVAYSDIRQVEFYAGYVLLPKSLQRGERLLLATSITRHEAGEYGERTPYANVGGQSSGGGFLNGIRGLFGGR
jgi:hypothetical protein